MTIHRFLVPAAAFVLAASAFGQALPGESLGLIPEVPPAREKPKSTPTEPKKKSSTEQESDDLQMRIRYREAKTKALADPRLKVEWDRAQLAKTEPEWRDAMKAYYRIFCDRVVKIDPTLKPRVETFRRSLTWRLEPGFHQRAKLPKPEDAADIESAERTARVTEN